VSERSVPHAINDPGKIVADLAVTPALDGDCLAGSRRFAPVRAGSRRARRLRTGGLGPRRCHAPTTAWSTHRGCWPRSPGPDGGSGEGVAAGWHAPPTTASAAIDPLIIDVDATLVTATDRPGD
jgi:hypothetical protein